MSTHNNQLGDKKIPFRNVLAAVAAMSVLSCFTAPVVAEQLIYTPVNPSFGGSPLNGPYLLNSAQAQKRYQPSMSDLGYPDFDSGVMVIAQGDDYIIFKKGDEDRKSTRLNSSH